MKKLLAFLTVAVFVGNSIQAQNQPYPLSTWSFNQQNNNVTTTSTDITATSVIIFGANGVGYNDACGQWGYQGKDWSSDTVVDLNKYYEFTITPPANDVLDISSISFSYNRSSHGPVKGQVRSSADNYSTSIDFNFNIAENCVFKNIGLGTNLAYSEITSPITFRIYPFAAGTNLNARVITLDNISVNGFVIPGITLPVKFISFKAAYSDNSIELDWSTAFEKDNEYFVIERSIYGNDFNEIGRVAGSLNSSSVKYYKFTDSDVSGNRALYRIRQVDLDGKFAYSNIIAVNIKKGQSETNAITVAGSNIVTLRHTSQTDALIKVDILDISGRILENYTLPVNKGQNYYDLTTGQLPSGTYLLMITTDQEIISQKFIR